MKYTYLDFLAENDKEFYKIQPFSVFLGLLLLTMTIIILINNESTLANHIKLKGVVKEIKMTKVKRLRDIPYGVGFQDDFDAVLIVVGNKKFHLDSTYEKFWDKILNKIKVGDYVTIYYKPIEEKDNVNIGQIEKEDEVVLPYTYRYSLALYFSIFCAVMFVLLTYWNIVILIKRKKIKINLI